MRGDKKPFPRGLKPCSDRTCPPCGDEEAAARFGALAQRLRDRGHEASEVAHLVDRLVFCLFAEDVGLLPSHLFRRMLEACQQQPDEFQPLASDLFERLRARGRWGIEQIAWFNGGLFDTAHALPLEKTDAAELLAAARLDWSEVDPSILGTGSRHRTDLDSR